MYLALETNQWVAILVGVACLGILVVIVVAPWRRIRSEPRMSNDVESRLLLGEDPKEIAEEEDEEARPRRGRRGIQSAVRHPVTDGIEG